MKQIILTCTGDVPLSSEPQRFVIEFDENLGEAQIVRAGAARIDRGNTAGLHVEVAHGEQHESGFVRFSVEVAP